MPATVEMQRARHQFLAGAALAEHQNGAVGVGHALHQSENLLHIGRGSDDLVELIFILELLAQVDVFRNGLVVGKSALHARFELLKLEWLFEIVVSALLHRIDRALNRAEASNDDDYRRRLQRS